MKRGIFFSMIIIFGFLGFCWAQEIDLEKIVVTPYRYGEDISKAASSVTVISQRDIKSSNAQKTVDVLRSVSGLMVRDWYGNATKAAVDIRGFGEQANLNVLVLIDGRRVNEVDLSGVDWTQIPLDQVERIEIIRGGSGSVLYGDNAVSGVINIVTKKGLGKPQLELKTQVGSYDMNRQGIFISGSKEAFSYRITASRDATHGYRENSYYKADDFGIRLIYDIEPEFSLRFSSSFHKSDYGLPGPLSSSDLQTMGRRASKYGDDHAQDKDYYFDMGMDKEFGDFGDFDIGFSFRKKQVDTFWLSSYHSPYDPTYKNTIDTFGLTPKYVLNKKIFGCDNKFVAGLDYYRSDYSSDNYNHSDALQNTTDIDKASVGYYLQNEYSILKDLTWVGGYRYESAKYNFDYHDNTGFNSDVDKDLKPNKKAYNFGLVYTYQNDSNLFLNTAQSFRFPATDEYFSIWGSPPVNTNLKPQVARNYELGIRHRFSPNLKFDLTLFRMNLKNELYYNPATYANENYDKTRHQGFEFSFDSKIIKNIGLFSNYSYTKATFKDGTYDDKNIPMVPRHKGSLGINFLLPKNINLNILGNYVGERYFINDQANSLSRLNGYFVADTNISYAYKDFTIMVVVNNIFDKKYSEYGVCNSTTGAKNYYPNPARNFSLKLEYKF